MEIIRIWTTQVAGAVIFGVLCEMLAPEGKLKSVVRVVLGLILVIAVISPFAGITNQNLLLGELTFFDNLTITDSQEIVETRATLVREFERRLTDEIQSRLAPITDDFTIEVEPQVHTNAELDDANFGAITGISVTITPLNDGDSPPDVELIKSDITAILTNDFSVAAENIQFWEGGNWEF